MYRWSFGQLARSLRLPANEPYPAAISARGSAELGESRTRKSTSARYSVCRSRLGGAVTLFHEYKQIRSYRAKGNSHYASIDRRVDDSVNGFRSHFVTELAKLARVLDRPRYRTEKYCFLPRAPLSKPLPPCPPARQIEFALYIPGCYKSCLSAK